MFSRWQNNRLILTPDRGDFEINSDRLIRIESHFVHNTGDFIAFANGTGAVANVLTSNIAEGDKQGIGVLRTGSTATGSARFGSGASASTSALQLGFHDWIWESMSRILVLATPTNSFGIVDGFTDTLSIGTITDGVCFTYIDTLNNGNWTATCVSNSVQRLVDTGIPASLNWEKRRITINKAGTSAKFFINGVQVAEITENIPVGVGRQTNLQFMIINQTGTITTRGVNVDYLECVGKR